MKIEELIDRNEKVLGEYHANLLKVEVNAYSKTSKEKDELESKFGEYKFPPSKELLELSGFGPFYEYGELIVESINKVAQNEWRLEIVFKKDEISNQGKWVKRVKK